MCFPVAWACAQTEQLDQRPLVHGGHQCDHHEQLNQMNQHDRKSADLTFAVGTASNGEPRTTRERVRTSEHMPASLSGMPDLVSKSEDLLVLQICFFVGAGDAIDLIICSRDIRLARLRVVPLGSRQSYFILKITDDEMGD